MTPTGAEGIAGHQAVLRQVWEVGKPQNWEGSLYPRWPQSGLLPRLGGGQRSLCRAQGGMRSAPRRARLQVTHASLSLAGHSGTELDHHGLQKAAQAAGSNPPR